MKQFFRLLLGVLFLCSVNAVFSQETPEEGALPSKAILSAAYAGNLDSIREILTTNPDRNVRDSLGGTALHVAVLRNNLEVIKLLLENGFDINAVVPPDGYAPLRGYTPLHYCVWTNNLGAARMLLLHGADKNIKAADGMTPAEKAAKEGKRDMLLLFFRR